MRKDNSFKYPIIILSLLMIFFGPICYCGDEDQFISTENLHQPCTTKEDCKEGQDCRVISGDQKTCEIYCNGDSDCPEGFYCNYCPEGVVCVWDPHACFKR